MGTIPTDILEKTAFFCATCKKIPIGRLDFPTPTLFCTECGFIFHEGNKINGQAVLMRALPPSSFRRADFFQGFLPLDASERLESLKRVATLARLIKPNELLIQDYECLNCFRVEQKKTVFPFHLTNSFTGDVYVHPQPQWRYVSKGGYFDVYSQPIQPSRALSSS